MVSVARDADLKYVDNTAPSPISVIALFERQPTLFCQQTRHLFSPVFMLFTSAASTDRTRASAGPCFSQGHRRLTLRANFLWTLTGNFVYAACQWGMLVILAKLATPQMVGEFALALAITAPIVVGAGLSLRSVQVTDAASEYLFGDYLVVRLLTTAAAGVVIVGIVWFFGYAWHTAAIILVIGLAKAFESISDIFYGLLQQHERMDRIALSMMMKGPLSLAALGAAIYLTRDLLLGVCSLAVVWLLLLILYDARNGASVLKIAPSFRNTLSNSDSALARQLQLSWRPHALIALTLLALPVGIVMALISFNTNIPRYFIEHDLGARELGIFAALAYPMAAGTTAINALGQSAAPRLARYYASRDCRAFSFLLRKLLYFGLGIGMGGVLLIWLAGRPILLLLYRPEYADHTGVFLWLGVAAGIGFVSSFLGYAMSAARYFRAQLPVFLIATLVTALGCAILVPRYRLSGAAIAMLLAAITQAVGSGVVITHALRSQRVK
jgi:O-antigen/teichoic acid export membrane protein